MDTRFSMRLTVPSYAVTPDATLRLSALLRWQQEIGEQHLATADLNTTALQARRLAFIVTRLRLRLTRLPAVGETVEMTTWHRETRGVQMFRCYTMQDANGAPLSAGVTAFALVDAKTHRLLRPDALGETLPADTAVCDCPDPAKETPPPLTEVATLRPRFSELDQNGHVNNTCYADLLCDHIPSGMARKKPLELAIAFEKEILPDDRLVIAAAERRVTDEQTSGGIAWVAGSHARGRAFAGHLLYEDDYARHF